MVESEVVEHSPHVPWDTIAGLTEARSILEEAVVLPQVMPEVFQGIRRPWKGILLFGPPGTGKTLLAKAIATECRTTFFSVSASTFASKWRGDSEKLVRLLFEMARFYAPSTVFIDEVDALGGKRSMATDSDASLRVKSELLVQMDGLAPSQTPSRGTVTVLAATNFPWNLDDALRRRFEKRIYIPLPDAAQRRQLFEINSRGILLSEDVDLEVLARKTEGYSGADVTSICRDAAMMCVRRVVQRLRDNGTAGEELQKQLREEAEGLKQSPVTQADFLEALGKVSSSVGAQDLQKFEDWMKEFGSA
ncbi:uncharacterized protein [Blastocystis hominis]|uniref:AAA+ ATPase domain-containing protein n=1 Tax=Blastocystis hominis TaxID=12968 RepID=D8M477_BLAHO|nr:uncharacterized protein [Blastocystis hominis]CBK22866.2 unnamed protein product [Blastocystis hominis]|eukprot:XP_012896914.1 uncharacterized protein [Blastocystis hominis]